MSFSELHNDSTDNDDDEHLKCFLCASHETMSQNRSILSLVHAHYDDLLLSRKSCTKD
jgi:hypothetical protein